MSLTLPVMVYGNGDLYRELFNAIATVMHTSGYHYLIHLSILLTGTWAILRYSVERSLSALGKWLAAYYAAFFIFFHPVATVEILDEVNQGKAYAVDNVPLGIAAMASFTSRIGAGLTALMEEIFSLPDDLKYSQTGMVMASRLVVNASQFEMTDPNFLQSMQGFVHQCVFYDLLLNKYTLNDLMKQQNLWQFLSQNASPARAFLYYPPRDSQGSPTVVTCVNGASNLSNDWNNALDQTAARYGARLFPEASDPKSQLMTYLPEAYNFLANTSQSATEILQQNLMANAIQNGVLQMGTTTNAPAALENYAFTKAQLQKRLSNETIGDMAAYWLPLMKNVLEAILYGAFVFVFLLLMFPFGLSVFKNYIGSLLWLQMWAPLYAILNLFMNYYAQTRTLGAMGGLHGEMGLSLYSQAGIAQVNADIASLAGYISLSIPLLARGVISGMSSVFAQAAQYIAGVTQGAGTGAAAEAVSGNYSMGNINYNNQSSFNTSANHFDTSGKVFGGMYTTQMSGGSTLSITPDGSVVMNNQGAISNLGVTAHLAQSLRASYIQQAERSETAGYNQLKASSEAMSSALRNVYELGSTKGTSNNSGESFTYSTNANVNDAVNQVHRLTDQFAHSHQISFGEASNVLGTAYAEGHGGLSASTPSKIVGANVGASGGYKRSSTVNDSAENKALYSDAKNFTSESGFSHNMDIVQRAVHEKSLRSSNETAQRLIENAGVSFDQALASRDEAVSSFQQAQSYRESASLAEEDAVNINSNASQIVFESLSKQGLSNAEIETLVVHHPDMAMAKASGALESYKQHLEEEWGHGLDGSSNAVQQASLGYNQKIKQQKDIQSDYQQHQQEVLNKPEAKKLADPKLLDESPRAKVEREISSNKENLGKEKSQNEKEGKAFTDKEKAETQKKRAGSSVRNMFKGVDTQDD